MTANLETLPPVLESGPAVQPVRPWQFSLRWLLVGMALIAIAGGIYFWANQFYRERVAAQRRELSRVQMTTVALLVTDHEHGVVRVPAAYLPSGTGRPLLSWRVAILPYMCEQQLYQAIRKDEPWDSPHNRQFHSRMPGVYRTPDINLPRGYSNILAVRGPRAFLGPPIPGEQTGPKRSALPLGAAQLLAIVEVNPDRAVPWMKPDEFEYDPADPLAGLGAIHTTDFLAIAGDCSVRFIPTKIARKDLLELFGHVSADSDSSLGDHSRQQSLQESLGR